MNAQGLVSAALRKIRVKRTGYSLTNDEATDGLEVLNTMLKGWAAHDLLIPYRTRETLTLTAGINPHTIGSGGTLNTGVPTDIVTATITVNGVDWPLDIKDVGAYQRETIKTDQAQPEWLYYERGAALGRIYFDAVPDANYTFVIDTLKALSTLTSLTTDFTLGDEYERAVILNLAVDLAPEWGKTADQTVMAEAKIALRRLKANVAASRVRSVPLGGLIKGSRRFNINRVE